ncbi:LOW QUALITY PROTEIN: cholesterol 22-monohydroxylase CYP90B51-like [Actinidia eriantha]|uniref:LOW QUALITY PROTEIN: cholesterol 22-monohydroxylase CYP90B51-like n=1 Tax=Actinidia eriantha TaxID=165200 RepID=UPI00258F1670|nr:LOW QUALITY PROTEIN: cholesterol 22-monohydroxylase CYP90B51-like [Actinidia eriantha]
MNQLDEHAACSCVDLSLSLNHESVSHPSSIPHPHLLSPSNKKKSIAETPTGITRTTHHRPKPEPGVGYGANTAEICEERVRKFYLRTGCKQAYTHQQLILTSDGRIIANNQTTSMILGERNLLELSGEYHKHVRRAFLSFLKPECPKHIICGDELIIWKFVIGAQQEDIAKNKSSGELLTWEDLNKMKYTWKVALETLRVVPPVFGGFMKALKDIEYGGYLIPQGWQIYWVTSMTHMDANIFQEPWKFDPARFENQSTIPPCCFVPFGGGAQVFPGYEFARIETLVTIHYVVTWKLCCTEETFSRDPMPVPHQGLPIQIMPKILLSH